MAEDKKDKQAEAPKAKAGGPNIIVLAVLVFVAGFGGSYLAIFLTPKTITVNQTTVHTEVKPPDTSHGLPTHPLGDFVVNLADASGDRFLKVSVSAKLFAKELHGEGHGHGEEESGGGHGGGHGGGEEAAGGGLDGIVEPYMPAIKDLVISYLSKKTSAEVADYEYRDYMKEEMSDLLNRVFHGEVHVYEVYFTDFIVQ